MTKKVKVFLIVLVVIIAGVGGYFVYNAQKAPSPEEKEVTKVTNKSTTKNVQGNGKTFSGLLFGTKSYQRCCSKSC